MRNKEGGEREESGAGESVHTCVIESEGRSRVHREDPFREHDSAAEPK